MIIKVVGIGPAGSQWLTQEAKKEIQWSDVLIGSSRQLECISDFVDASQKTFAYESVHKDLTEYIDMNLNNEKTLAVLASGDPSLYGIGRYLTRRYGKDKVRIIPGISSLQYLFAMAGQDMNDVYLTSCHGREVNFDRVFEMPKTGILTDSILGPYEIAQEAIKRGLNPRIVIGERLGYKSEKITIDYAEFVQAREYDLNAVIVINSDEA